MTSAMRRVALALLAAVLALGLAAGAANAAKGKKVRSQVEIEWFEFVGGYRMFGDVHSKKTKCERNRTVTLEVSGEFIGTGRTDRTGDWAIPADLDFNEPFIASVEKKTTGTGDKKLVCKAAESPPIIFEP